MIYTVTLNPAIDKTVELSNLTPGQVNRVQRIRTDPGGKGINVSKCLAALGEKSIAALFLGGSSGELLASLIRQEGIAALPISIDGTTRTNLKIIDLARHENTDINEPGPAVSPSALEAMEQQLSAHVQSGDILVLSGSLPVGVPADIYRKWITHFQGCGARVLLDASGSALEKGIQAAPFLIKPNQEELSHLARRPLSTPEACLEAGKALVSQGVKEVVISMGAEGAIYTSSEETFRVLSPRVKVRSTVGAGDSMVAAMAYAAAHHLSAREAMTLASAMGAASVTCSGSQAPSLSLIQSLQKEVVLQTL